MSEETTKPQAPASAMMMPRVDKDAPEGGPKSKKRGRRKVSYLTLQKIDTVDYKDIALLKRFLNDRGKILPSRQSGNTAKQQRMVAEAIRRARELALIPFVVTDTSADRQSYRRQRRDDYGDRQQNTSQE